MLSCAFKNGSKADCPSHTLYHKGKNHLWSSGLVSSCEHLLFKWRPFMCVSRKKRPPWGAPEKMTWAETARASGKTRLKQAASVPLPPLTSPDPPSLLHSVLQLRRQGRGRALSADRGHRAHPGDVRRCVDISVFPPVVWAVRTFFPRPVGKALRD